MANHQRSKKKQLSDSQSNDPGAIRISGYLDSRKMRNLSTAFVAPELGGPDVALDAAGYDMKPAWDVAARYQDLKRYGHLSEKEKKKLKRRAVQGILDRVQSLMGAVLHPEVIRICNQTEFIESGSRGDLDLVATFEERDWAREWSYQDLRYSTRVDRNVDVALVIDASLSMTGEKIALLAVAASVVAVSVPASRFAVLGFDSQVRWIKRFHENLDVLTVIERILDLPAGGFTNLELALEQMLRHLEVSNRMQSNVILISDGKYTEGADPTSLATRFRRLNALKIGRDQAGRELLVELSTKGNGRFFEARRAADLPRTMYGAMKSLLR